MRSTNDSSRELYRTITEDLVAGAMGSLEPEDLELLAQLPLHPAWGAFRRAGLQFLTEVTRQMLSCSSTLTEYYRGGFHAAQAVLRLPEEAPTMRYPNSPQTEETST